MAFGSYSLLPAAHGPIFEFSPLYGIPTILLFFYQMILMYDTPCRAPVQAFFQFIVNGSMPISASHEEDRRPTAIAHLPAPHLCPWPNPRQQNPSKVYESYRLVM